MITIGQKFMVKVVFLFCFLIGNLHKKTPSLSRGGRL